MRCFVLVLLGVACSEGGTTTATTSQQSSMTIAGVSVDSDGPCPSSVLSDVGSGQASNCHYFTLWSGTPAFPQLICAPGASGCCADYQYTIYPTVVCDNGRVYSADTGNHAAASYCSPSQINVAIAGDTVNTPLPRDPKTTPTSNWPVGTACWFMITSGPANFWYPPSSASFSNFIGPIPSSGYDPNTISAVSASGNVLQLIGHFPNPESSATVVCNQASVGGVTVSRIDSQHVNVTIPSTYTTTSNSCEVGLQDSRGAPGGVSNTVAIRLGPLPATLPYPIGAYYWGSYVGLADIQSQTLPGAVATMKNAGISSVVRIAIGPDTRRPGADFTHLDPSMLQSGASNPSCALGSAFLPCEVTQPPFQTALNTLPTAGAAHPVFVILTAYDSTMTGDYGVGNSFIYPSIVADPATQSKVIAEYSAMTYQLYKTQAGTGRTFVVSNWEESVDFRDCGAPNSLGNLQGTYSLTSACASLPSPSQQQACAYTQYLLLRQKGISDGTQRAHTDGFGLEANAPVVAMGVEFRAAQTCSRGSISCQSDSWCGVGQTCNGQCNLTSAACSGDASCVHVCSNDHSRVCSSSLDCASGGNCVVQTCGGGTCSGGAFCSTAADCLSGQQCLIGTNSQLACAVPSVSAGDLTLGSAAVPEFVSYSSWQGVNRGTLDDDLAGINSFLSSATASPHPGLIVGELGAEEIGIPNTGIVYGNNSWALAQNAKAALRAAAKAVVVWIHTGSVVNFPNGSGLFKPSGAEEGAMAILRSKLAGYNATVPATVQITGSHDVGIDASWLSTPVAGPRRWFELYGTFASCPVGSTSCSVTVRCHSMSYSDASQEFDQTCYYHSSDPGTCYLNYVSPSQINVGFVAPIPTYLDWCTFQVASPGGTSPEYGPRAACALPHNCLNCAYGCNSSANMCTGQPPSDLWNVLGPTGQRRVLDPNDRCCVFDGVGC
jgi:hypothetical protein